MQSLTLHLKSPTTLLSQRSPQRGRGWQVLYIVPRTGLVYIVPRTGLVQKCKSTELYKSPLTGNPNQLGPHMQYKAQ